MSILSLPAVLALIFSLVLFGAQVIKRSFLEKNLKKIFWAPVAIIFSLSVVFSAIQYNTWKQNELMKIVLEQTDGGLNAFFYSSFMNYFVPHLLALFFAGTLAILMTWINKRSGGRFFEREETLIAFLAGFFSGFPGFIFFLLGIAITYFVAHLVFATTKKTAKSGVIPLYYFWLPISAFVILTSTMWFSKHEFWRILSV